MTRYIDNTKKKVKENVLRKTVFKKVLNYDLKIKLNNKDLTPENFENVEFIGHDLDYGDVFKAWNGEYLKSFLLFFGKKGDEFK